MDLLKRDALVARRFMQVRARAITKSSSAASNRWLRAAGAHYSHRAGRVRSTRSRLEARSALTRSRRAGLAETAKHFRWISIPTHSASAVKSPILLA